MGVDRQERAAKGLPIFPLLPLALSVLTFFMTLESSPNIFATHVYFISLGPDHHEDIG